VVNTAISTKTIMKFETYS